MTVAAAPVKPPEIRSWPSAVLEAEAVRLIGRLAICFQLLVAGVYAKALATRSGVTASTLRDAIYTHPSSTEAFNELLATVVR